MAGGLIDFVFNGTEGGGEWGGVGERTGGEGVGTEGWVRQRYGWYRDQNGKSREASKIRLIKLDIEPKYATIMFVFFCICINKL